jgi:hypothetical protein
MFASVHCPDVDEGVCMVCGGTNDGINILLVEAFSPILICFSFRELIGGFGEVFGVDVTEGDDILAFDVVHI